MSSKLYRDRTYREDYPDDRPGFCFLCQIDRPILVRMPTTVTLTQAINCTHYAKCTSSTPQSNAGSQPAFKSIIVHEKFLKRIQQRSWLFHTLEGGRVAAFVPA